MDAYTNIFGQQLGVHFVDVVNVLAMGGLIFNNLKWCVLWSFWMKVTSHQSLFPLGANGVNVF